MCIVKVQTIINSEWSEYVSDQGEYSYQVIKKVSLDSLQHG